MCTKVKGNHFYNLTKCLHMTFRYKEKIGLQKMKMKLQVTSLLICVLLELMTVRLASCSPVPDNTNRLKSVYKNTVQKLEKCPPGLVHCTCIERNNVRRTLDVTCNGVNTDQLKHDSDILKQGGDHVIQYFKIRNCNIPRLADHIFMGMKIQHLYIHNCNLQSLDTASISSQGSTLSHLVLSKNQLKDVPTRALKSLKNLDHLNLNENKITSLHANAFEGLTKVTRLSIYDNQIKHISPDAFDGLTKDLIRLNLGRNKLKEVPFKALKNLYYLQILEMSDNQITSIKPEGFEGLENLDQLVLNHNQLTEINAKWFKGLENLHDLKLCNNEISHIDDAAFEGLEETLESLELTDNQLQVFPSHALRPIHKLVTLHIDHNKINRISEDAFQGFGEKMKYLWMQENRIEDIPPPAFQDLHSLEWVKLYNNKLKTLHYELMEPVLDSLMHIDIHSNPLVCDCELRWYKQWINDEWNPVEETWLKDTICTSPKDGKQHLISEVDLKDMFCDSSVKDMRGKDGGGAASMFRVVDWILIALFGTFIQILFPSVMNKC